MPSLARCVVGVLLLAAGPARGAAFATDDQGALARSFALPALGEVAVLGASDSQTRVTFDLTNEYVALAQGGEELLADGETMRLALQYRHGLGDSAEWGVELPVQRVGGGVLDGFIEDWHRWFGLPNGGREQAAQDQYEYRYRRGGVTQLDATDTGTSLGDVLLLGGWRWRDGVVLRGEVKLPTGDADRLGGGNPGGALWADAALPFAPGSAWSGFVSGGASLAGRGDVLPDQQNRLVPLAGGGLFYRALPALDLGAQVSAHGRLYRDSELDALRRPGVQLVFGGQLHAQGGARVDLAIQEDIVTRSSPDFSIQVAVTMVTGR